MPSDPSAPDALKSAASEASSAPSGGVLAVENVSKHFPGVQALDGVTLTFSEGEVHGLVGGNGAGKSTLIKVISGAIRPDKGRVVFSRDDHSALNIATIHQELMIVPKMTALSNVFLGKPIRRGFLLDRRRMLARFRRLAGEVGAHIAPMKIAGDLSVADQQLIEIMRALAADHTMIIMDEPTASLGENERKKLHSVVKDLARRGKSIIYISHDLDEVISLSDRISVMRDGKLIASHVASRWSKDQLVQTMLNSVIPTRAPAPVATLGRSNIVLSVRDLKVSAATATLSFDLYEGEILGIAGLVGSGRTEILQALAGASPAISGVIDVLGQELAPPSSIREALKQGIALAPEDRKRYGLVLSQTGEENITLTNIGRSSSFGIVRSAKAGRVSKRVAGSVGFGISRLAAEARTLSGGNQQKLVIGKWLPRQPRVLLLDEPTRGIDVGAKAEIHRTIRSLCGKGMSAIMVCSELEELVENCDRILVIASGALLRTLTRDNATVDELLGTIFGTLNSPGRRAS